MMPKMKVLDARARVRRTSGSAMMFFGTSGVLSHTLMHGPMANDSDSDSDSQSNRMRRDVSTCASFIDAFVRSFIHRRGW